MSVKTASGLCKRIIPCLDVAHGRTVKGVKFTGLRDAGDPVALALAYEEQGADEIVFLDIRASHEGRSTTLHLVEQVAAKLSIPFTVGGGISTLDDVLALLRAGADKVSVNTAAVTRPELIAEIALNCGSQCCVLAIDARRKPAIGEWEVLTHGGRRTTDLDAFAWAQKGVELGAGEILLTSWDQDGTQSGFDLELCRTFAQLPVPIIASGGAKDAESFIDVFTDGKADAALAATIFHDGIYSVRELKTRIDQAGIPVRIC